MTTYDKAKAYEYVSQKVKDFFEGKQKMYSDVKQTLEYLFPELAESEDERVRKNCIHFLELQKEHHAATFEIEECIAWLEKQGETFTKRDVDDAYLKGICDAKRELEKQGDVLVDKELSELLHRVVCYYISNPDIPYSDRENVSEKIIPYVEKLEKQGEKKPIISNDAIREGIAHFGITQYQIDNWLKKYVDIEKQGEQKPTDSYCEEHCKGFQETGKCYADGECKAKRDTEQNPAWSEEDEDAIGMAIEALEDLYDEDCPNDSFIGYNLSFYEAVERLKVLKPQPHWKPTEQQMNALKQTSENDYVMYNTILKSLYNDLKKL